MNTKHTPTQKFNFGARDANGTTPLYVRADAYESLVEILRNTIPYVSKARGTWPTRCNCESADCVECAVRAAIAKAEGT